MIFDQLIAELIKANRPVDSGGTITADGSEEDTAGSLGPSAELFSEVRSALKKALRREMQRRGLWELPPYYLGIYGCPNWWQGDCLEDLLSELYCYIFIRRLQSLMKHHRMGKRMSGLITLNIRHFLHDRQRANDPMGARVFQALRSACERGIEDKFLCLSGGSRIDKDAILCFTSRSGSTTGQSPEPTVELTSTVRAWCGELMPDLILGSDNERKEAQETLYRKLIGLSSLGVRRLPFKELLDPLRQGIRAFHSYWATEDLDIAFEEGERLEARQALAQIESKGTDRVDDYREFLQVSACVEKTLEKTNPDGKKGQEETRLSQSTVALPERLLPTSRRPRSPSRLPSRLQLGNSSWPNQGPTGRVGQPLQELPAEALETRSRQGSCPRRGVPLQASGRTDSHEQNQ